MKDVLETVLQVAFAVGGVGYGLYLLWQKYLGRPRQAPAVPPAVKPDDEKAVIDIARRLRHDGRTQAANVAQSLLLAMLDDKKD